MNKYYLAMEHQYQDFFPINNVMGNLPPNYLYDIKTIDKFTQKFENETELKKYLLTLNMIDSKEMNSSITLYYFDQKMRKLFDGICYKENSKYLEPDYLKEILIINKENKEMLNHIVCKFRDSNLFKETTIAYKLFIQNLFKITENDFFILDLLNYLKYHELRAIGLFIKEEINKLALKDQVIMNNDINIKTYSFKKGVNIEQISNKLKEAA